MKIEHVDGGPWVLTLSSEEASIICYTVPSTLAGDGCDPGHPLYMEFLRYQSEVLSAMQVPGSKDSVNAYGREQALDMQARLDQTVAQASEPIPPCPTCGRRALSSELKEVPAFKPHASTN